MKLLDSFSPLSFARICYVTVLSISVCFISLDTHAQEKEQVTIKNKTFAYEITKETTAADLEQIEKEINAEKVAHLRFSNVKRNAKQEIIGLTTEFKDERGSSQKKSEYNSQGIRPFSVKIHENAAGQKYLELANSTAPFSTNNPGTGVPSLTDFFNNDEDEDDSFGSDSMMDMMRSIQESMFQQQETIMKLFEEAEKKKE